MRYCDLHCDTLTTTQKIQITVERLREGDCLLQCFAVFLREKEGRFARAQALIQTFNAMCEEWDLHSVRRACDVADGRINAVLTVEGGGAIEGDLRTLDSLYASGVRMMTLTWNEQNELGFPNFPDYEGLFTGRTSFWARETERGLTPFGFETVARMKELKMIVDVSHGSDKLFWDVKSALGKTPFVASHSNAECVYAHARNLLGEQIRAIAESGGVIGLNFCADFLSDDKSAEGQKQALLAHARAIVQLGGEDVLAIGSDFDGIPQNAYLRTPADMPDLFARLEREFGVRIAEKIASKNALRVFREVCGA